MKTYLTYAEYVELNYNEPMITDETEFNKLNKVVTNNINILTFNRIIKIGFDELSEYRQDVIKDVISSTISFYYENDELINCVLKNYSINGQAMSFGDNWNVFTKQGVAIKSEDYKLLTTTGLCNLTLR